MARRKAESERWTERVASGEVNYAEKAEKERERRRKNAAQAAHLQHRQERQTATFADQLAQLTGIEVRRATQSFKDMSAGYAEMANAGLEAGRTAACGATANQMSSPASRTGPSPSPSPPRRTSPLGATGDSFDGPGGGQWRSLPPVDRFGTPYPAPHRYTSNRVPDVSFNEGLLLLTAISEMTNLNDKNCTPQPPTWTDPPRYPPPHGCNLPTAPL